MCVIYYDTFSVVEQTISQIKFNQERPDHKTGYITTEFICLNTRNIWYTLHMHIIICFPNKSIVLYCTLNAFNYLQRTITTISTVLTTLYIVFQLSTST